MAQIVGKIEPGIVDIKRFTPEGEVAAQKVDTQLPKGKITPADDGIDTGGLSTAQKRAFGDVKQIAGKNFELQRPLAENLTKIFANKKSLDEEQVKKLITEAVDDRESLRTLSLDQRLLAVASIIDRKGKITEEAGSSGKKSMPAGKALARLLGTWPVATTPQEEVALANLKAEFAKLLESPATRFFLRTDNVGDNRSLLDYLMNTRNYEKSDQSGVRSAAVTLMRDNLWNTTTDNLQENFARIETLWDLRATLNQDQKNELTQRVQGMVGEDQGDLVWGLYSESRPHGGGEIKLLNWVAETSGTHSSLCKYALTLPWDQAAKAMVTTGQYGTQEVSTLIDKVRAAGQLPKFLQSDEFDNLAAKSSDPAGVKEKLNDVMLGEVTDPAVAAEALIGMGGITRAQIKLLAKKIEGDDEAKAKWLMDGGYLTRLVGAAGPKQEVQQELNRMVLSRPDAATVVTGLEAIQGGLLASDISKLMEKT
ncbi:hypothetical protein ACFL6C_12865, partial [Myxococcota bacterium]